MIKFSQVKEYGNIVIVQILRKQRLLDKSNKGKIPIRSRVLWYYKSRLSVLQAQNNHTDILSSVCFYSFKIWLGLKLLSVADSRKMSHSSPKQYLYWVICRNIKYSSIICMNLNLVMINAYFHLLKYRK